MKLGSFERFVAPISLVSCSYISCAISSRLTTEVNLHESMAIFREISVASGVSNKQWMNMKGSFLA